MSLSSPGSAPGTGRGKWGSKIGFVLAASGSAVGLGNIWRFPYTAGKNGGALFLFFYLVSIVMIALPVLIAETSLGRFTGQNPVGAFRAIKPKGPWKLVGYLGVLTGVMILSYYSVIAGWTIGYFYKAVTGKFSQISKINSGEIFGGFISNTGLQMILLAVFLGMTIWVVSRGVSSGIEKYAKILMPGLFILLLLLLFRSLTLDGASEGLAFYLKPDFSKLNAEVIIDAMGQAFFSMSLGMGAMITYGSYLRKEESLPNATSWVAFFDTFIAVIAGFIIFPAIFSQGMNPAEGPGLVFNILPVIFAQMPMGEIFGPLFFALLTIAALTSTVSLLEVATSYCIDEKKWSRKKSAILVGVITFIFGIPSVLAFSNIKFFNNVPLVNMDFLSLMDKIWGNLALSIGALFISIFVAYVWKTSKALEEIRTGTGRYKFAGVWTISMKILSPLLILAILVLFVIRLFPS